MNGRVVDPSQNLDMICDLLAEDGKIVKIGQKLPVPKGTEELDATGKMVYPGFVEAHGHIGLDNYGMGIEGHDYNESNDSVTPQMRAIDGIQPADFGLREAAAAGVTTIGFGRVDANLGLGIFF